MCLESVAKWPQARDVASNHLDFIYRLSNLSVMRGAIGQAPRTAASRSTMPESASNLPENPPLTPAPAPTDDSGDAPPLGLWGECRIAMAFLTVVPVALAEPPPPLAAAVRAFPLIGVAVGLVGAAIFALADMLTLATSISALLAVGAMVLLSGGLHEDGLADTADSLGGRDRESRLAIMRDSRIGTFGAESPQEEAMGKDEQPDRRPRRQRSVCRQPEFPRAGAGRKA